MALPIPDKMSRDRFRNDAEFAVYSALHEQLSDDWVLVPSLELRLDSLPGERELDLLLIHPYYGLLIVEVKSFAFYVLGGQFFYFDGRPLGDDPLDQVRAQRNYLAKLLGDLLPHGYNDIRFAIASPETIVVEGALGPQLHQRQLFGGPDLADVHNAVLNLCEADQFFEPLGEDRFERILQVLCPNGTLVNSKAALRQLVRSRMEQRLVAETRVLETLDRNRRVFVTGGAGTGKTRLAVAWAKRAAANGDRVLFTMYNDPLADALSEELSGSKRIVVAPFLRLLEQHLGTSAPEGNAETQQYWDGLPGAAEQFLHENPLQFDTVIVDEAQDFPQEWFDLLQRLVRPGGRLFAVADPRQNLRHHKFALSYFTEGWAQAELLSNGRNAPAIAQLLRRRLHGAASPNKEPFSTAVQWTEAVEDQAVVEAVSAALAEQSELKTWVLTISATTRDLLISRLGLVRFEQRGEQGAVVCETYRRLKGLDVDRLIFVADHLKPTDVDELYTSISRANEELVVISSREVGEVLGLVSPR
ncbi:MAG: NERD domain-containing protein/DEAD/DEAH box helicase [Actinomycetes bacterium]